MPALAPLSLLFALLPDPARADAAPEEDCTVEYLEGVEGYLDCVACDDGDTECASAQDSAGRVVVCVGEDTGAGVQDVWCADTGSGEGEGEGEGEGDDSVAATDDTGKASAGCGCTSDNALGRAAVLLGLTTWAGLLVRSRRRDQ